MVSLVIARFHNVSYWQLICFLVLERYSSYVAINFSKENDFFSSFSFLPVFPSLPYIHSFVFSVVFYSSPPVKGSYFCTVSRLLVFPSFHSIWSTFIFQLPDNNSSNNEVAWKQAIRLSFLKDILLPFRKQTFCRTALLTTSMSETRLKGTDFTLPTIHWNLLSSVYIWFTILKIDTNVLRMTKLLILKFF